MKARPLATVLLTLAAVAVALIRLRGHHFEWLLWSDRDLVRSATWFSDLRTTGPELSHGVGAGLPGGAFHALLALPLLGTSDPQWVWRWQALLDTLGMLVLVVQVRRLGGPLAAAATAVAWLTAEGLDDTAAKLWNPAFLPPFLGWATAAWLAAIAEGRGKALAWAGVAIGLGAQMHASAWIPAVAMLPAVLVVRPPGWRMGLLGAALGALLTFAPHLLDEATSGFPNTRALLEQSYLRAPRETFSAAHALAHGGVLLRGLVVDGELPLREGRELAVLAGRVCGVLVGLLALLGLVRARRGQRPEDRAVLALATVVALGAVYVATDARLDLRGYGGYRYMLFAVPAFAGWVGLAVGRLGALPAGVGTTALLASAVLVGWRTAIFQAPRDSWASLNETVAVVRAETGWTLREVVGRTAFVNGDDARTFHLVADDGVAWLLRAEGVDFPGSLPGPCALVFARSLPPSIADGEQLRDDALDVLFARVPHPELRVLGLTKVRNLHVLTYDPGPMRCPTTFAQRYLPSDVQVAAWEAVRHAEDAVPVELPVPAGRRVAVGLDVTTKGTRTDGRLALAITLQPGPGSLTVGLDASQLAGKAYNQGLFLDGAIGHPRVVLRSPAGRTTLPLAWDVVGHQAELTPIEATVGLAPGRWEVTLELDRLSGWLERDADLTKLPRAPVTVPLGEIDVPGATP